MIMMSTITLEHCPGPDWWDFEDNNYDISEWPGPWWSPWRMIGTVMIILENYQWCDFDSELHDAIGGEEQGWELSRCGAGFQIVNIGIIFCKVLKYCEYPDYIVHIVIIFWTQLQYSEYCELFKAIHIFHHQRWRDTTRESTFATPRTELVNLRPLRSRCKSSVSWVVVKEVDRQWWWLWWRWWWWWFQRWERSRTACVRSDIAASALWVDVEKDDRRSWR